MRLLLGILLGLGTSYVLQMSKMTPKEIIKLIVLFLSWELYGLWLGISACTRFLGQ